MALDVTNCFTFTFISNHSKESFTCSQIHQLLGVNLSNCFLWKEFLKNLCEMCRDVVSAAAIQL